MLLWLCIIIKLKIYTLCILQSFNIGGIYWNAAYIACVHNTTVFLRPDSTNIRLTLI